MNLTSEQGRHATNRIFPSGRLQPAQKSSNTGSKLLLCALVAGILLVGSAGVGRELVNARDLAAQVQVADEARAKAEAIEQGMTAYVNGITEQATAMWKAGNYDQSLALMRAAEDSDEKAIIGLRTIRADLYGGDIELMQADLNQIKDDQ